MANSQQCSQPGCNNRTLGPTGRCYLHKIHKGRGDLTDPQSLHAAIPSAEGFSGDGPADSEWYEASSIDLMDWGHSYTTHPGDEPSYADRLDESMRELGILEVVQENGLLRMDISEWWIGEPGGDVIGAYGKVIQLTDDTDLLIIISEDSEVADGVYGSGNDRCFLDGPDNIRTMKLQIEAIVRLTNMGEIPSEVAIVNLLTHPVLDFMDGSDLTDDELATAYKLLS